MREARARRADIVMYGHTHRPCIEYINKLSLNPEYLLSKAGEAPLYIIMEIDRAGERHITR